MNILIPTTALLLVASFAFVCSRSVPTPDLAEKTHADNQNVILLEVPVPEGAAGQSLEFEGDRLLLRGKNFSSLSELENMLREDRKVMSHQDAVTPEPFNLVVPVARNFSSVKELFEILRNDRSRPQKVVSGKEQDYVKGTETLNSDFMIFFTS